MNTRTSLVLLATLLPVWIAQAQEMQWEDYAPKSTLVVPEHPITRARYPFIDAHAHQWRIGGMSEEDMAGIVAEMDKMNMGVMVNLSGGSGDRLKTAVQNTEQHFPGRFVHFANVNFDNIDDPDFGAKAAAQLEADVNNGAKGLKIFKSLGMFVTDAAGERVPTDDPRLDPIWAKCGELGIPVLIHTGDPAPFWEPHDQYNERWFELKERPRRKREPEPSWEQIMSEQWNVFRKHPNTVFINAHLGWLGNDLARLGKLMDEMPNVYTELGAVLAEPGRQPRFAREWFIQYQDRVMMGKDSWNPEEYHPYFRAFETADEFFDYYRKRHAWWKLYGFDLPDEVLRKIYYKNALRVIPGIDTSRFPDDYNVEVVAAPGARPSPMQLARTTLDNGTYVKVHYSSPVKRGRIIFGELVPYDQLWRTAANEATEITLTGNLRVGGETLRAGTYSIFTIPGEETWTVIFNNGLGQNGTGGYREEEDALRLQLPSSVTEKLYEAFTVAFEEADGGADLVLMWDRTKVTVPIRTM
ncbi:MAG: DUF2911 domain-containing protein [Rhodothermales bacterium]